ncbi:MAG: transporter substrate-binding domain-containing protein [Pseudomonadota bacterium]
MHNALYLLPAALLGATLLISPALAEDGAAPSGTAPSGSAPAASQTEAKPKPQTSWKKEAPPRVSRIQNPDRTFTPGADYDTIIERGWMSFGVYEDFAPYSWIEDGEHKGLDVELGRMIAEEFGVEARFTVMGADETVDDDLRNYVWKGPLIGGDVVNVMMHVPYHREFAIRNELVVLTGLYMTESVGIAYSKTAYPDDPPTPAYFRYDLVGVENDSLADFYLSSAFGGQLATKTRRFTATADAMAALRAGEVKAVMGPLAQIEFGLDADTAVHSPPLPGLAIGNWPLGIALRHNYRQLGYAVDDAIRAARESGRLQAVFERYGLSYTDPPF